MPGDRGGRPNKARKGGLVSTSDARGSYQPLPTCIVDAVASDGDIESSIAPASFVRPSRGCGVAAGIAALSCGALVACLLPRPRIVAQEAPLRRDQAVDREQHAGYDCHAGSGAEVASWPDRQRRWCCGQAGVGCAARGLASGGQRTFDCQAGLTHWERGWSEAKKAYCCAISGAGCPPRSPPMPSGCHPDHPQSQGCPYDCAHGVENWVALWSPSKKAYCCRTTGQGCVQGVQFQCDVGSETFLADWPAERRDWCCKERGVACPKGVVVFDCYAGFGSWQTTWSVAKQNWCCVQVARGCTAAPTTAPNYDCYLGIMQWRHTWSDAKKKFCCAHEGVGCPTVSPNGAALTTSTTTEAFHGFGPEECDTNLVDWQTTWDSVKKAWCCQHHGRGCVGGQPQSCASFACPAGWGRRLGTNFCGGPKCDQVRDLPACCVQSPPKPTTPIGAPCSSFTCPRGYFPKENEAHLHCVGFPCDVASDTLTCCNRMMRCDLNCYGDGAKPVALAGAGGSGDDLMLSGVSLRKCEDECLSADGCEGIVFGEAGGQCFGKKDIHTSKCQPGGAYITEVLKARPWGKCVLMGDPHIIPFDRPYGPALDELSPGDYWLIRSASLALQGRFATTQRFPKEASTVGIAVDGALVGGKRLVVQYVGPIGTPVHTAFRVTWNGQAILTDKKKIKDEFRSAQDGFEAFLDDMDPDQWHRDARHTIGGTAGKLPSFLFRFHKAHVNIYILLGPDNFNAIIEAKKVPGQQDGLCGNFDCNQDDDSEDLARRGLSEPLAVADSMFAGNAPQPLGVVPRKADVLAACDPQVRGAAESTCSRLPEWQRDGCIFDACARNDEKQIPQDVALGALSLQLEHQEIERGQ
mmetsp:Transcript_6345/g.18139  ORF Transcript_6345/g.18139 Transcript_6345/m.18139 type:complete len:863 (-) Transcript_6345:310-2898(-)